MAADPPILDVRGLTHLFDQGRSDHSRSGHSPSGVRALSFSVSRGEFLVLAGINGSGKTTLLRLLMGLIRPQSGEILLNGRDIFQDLRAARQEMGLIFQDADTQILGETVRSEIAFGPENLGLDRQAIDRTVDQVMEKLRLTPFAERHPATLSGGEKRRLTIAGILAMAPSVILFDEPFANLDYPGICRLAREIMALHRAGTTIIMATHDLDPVLAAADRIMVMEKGRLAAQGKVRDMAPRLAEFGMRPWCPACHPLEIDLEKDLGKE